MNEHRHLAWHETMELHELTVFQSLGLMKLKKTYPKITDPELKKIYQQAIHSLTGNIQELLRFYRMAPHMQREENLRVDELPFYAGDLLAFLKTAVRNLAIAITETATPALRAVLVKQLNGAIESHTAIYNYMYKKGYYPSYDLNRLLQNDVAIANTALSQKI
ncbi:spore coat protein [Bacillus badius]|uniref:Spore coat protein F n=1 Tax=Bacillus badius TaxID=1455 RepID=A0ABR5AX55_BACBA|nr:spore coat protein [Bacillus badius]KIL76126.1 Spore coat protein F [Bacillus badius]KIL79310.1 Spore coat protein F [Bacillus badius]MED4716496.1 spore coat protein [Bacillus badius]